MRTYAQMSALFDSASAPMTARPLLSTTRSPSVMTAYSQNPRGLSLPLPPLLLVLLLASLPTPLMARIVSLVVGQSRPVAITNRPPARQ